MQLAIISEGVELTDTGVKFHTKLTRDQFRTHLKYLKTIESRYEIVLSDYLTEGRKLFGWDEVIKDLTQLEFNEFHAKRAMAIGSLDLFCRHPQLTSDHYHEFYRARLDRADQIRWSNLCVEHNMTPIQLRLSIKAGKVLSGAQLEDRSGKDSGLPNIYGFRGMFESWYKPLVEHDPIERWGNDRKREIFDELREPGRLAVRLAKDLGEEL